MDVAAPTKTHYDLYARPSERRFVWRFTDHGVTLEDDAVSIVIHGQWVRLPFDRILSVTLSSNAIPRSGKLGQCTIETANHVRYVIGSGNERGVSDARQIEFYRLFLRDFHRRLIASDAAKKMRFASGYPAWRANGLAISLVFATGLFVVLPVFLLLIVRDIKILGALIPGALFVWPMWRVLHDNTPGVYSPNYPPDLLD